MINFISKQFQKNNSGLENILKLIEKDLSSLNSELIKSLVSGNPHLDDVINYVFKSGGKRLRPALVILFAKALNKGNLSSYHFQLAEVVEMIHTASLLHDDVVDNAETRRGILTAGKKWNSKTAVLSGDYILAGALEKLVTVNSSVVKIYAETLSQLCQGEIFQENQSYKLISIEEYIKKSERKTARLFIAGVESVAITTQMINDNLIKASKDYALNYGIAFQIMDDIQNLVCDKNKTGKPAGLDLKNGIITAPVIFAVEEYEKNNENKLNNFIYTKFRKEKDLKEAVKLITNSSGIEKSLIMVDEYINKAVYSIFPLEDSKFKQALIDMAFVVKERIF
jgi:geranylgeranyl pyrophosphate synthase